MSSTIKCISCKQRINLAPDAAGIVTCPMCKTQQPVPEDQGQNAPQLPPQPNAHSQHSSPSNPSATGHGPIDRSGPIDRKPLNPPPSHIQHDFDSQKSGCGCLLAGLLVAVTAVSLLFFFIPFVVSI